MPSRRDATKIQLADKGTSYNSTVTDSIMQNGRYLSSTFIETGISVASVKNYEQTFSSEEIIRDSLHMLYCTMFQDYGWHTKANQRTPSITPITSWSCKTTNSRTSSTQLGNDLTTILKIPNRLGHVHKNDQSLFHIE